MNARRLYSAIPKLATTPNKYNAKSSAFNLKPVLPEGLFFHPAPSAPNPKITPKALLPKDDIRKTSEIYYPEQDQYYKTNLKYMPIISNTNVPKNYNHNPEIVAKIQELRDQGVSRSQIKEELNVTDNFISLVTKANPKTAKNQIKLERKQTQRWSLKTKRAKEIKAAKQQQWERDL